jgi:glycosyltransferase involved in cell wall biosynthesis
MKLIVSQLGARMHYAVPRMLHAQGRLQRFYTDICATKGWPKLLRAVPGGVMPTALRRLTGRVPFAVPESAVVTFPSVGVGFGMRRARAKTPTEQTEAHLWAGRELSRRLVSHVQSHGVGAAGGVYGFSGECLEALVAMRARGLKTVVEQIVAPKLILDRLVLEEEERFPGWSAVSAFDGLSADYAARELEEWATADLVVCGSGFVRDGVIASGVAPARCVVVPYGVDMQGGGEPRRRALGPLRVLTVGGVGLRKGTPYVLEAAGRLGARAEFRMVGACDVVGPARAALADAVTLTGAVPRTEIAAHYAWADVFLLPSICEGSATVVYEALAAGLPVVTTPNAGSVVRDGVDGYVVPIRDVDAIEAALAAFAADAELYERCSLNARARARAFDLPAYGRRLVEAIDAAPAAALSVPLAAAV